MEQNYCNSFKIKLIKTTKTIKQTYTDSEIEKLLKKPNIKTCEFSEYRTWVMTNFFLGTAVRISTLLFIKIGDVDLVNNQVVLHKVKNRNQQIIPVSYNLSKIISKYLEIRKGNDEDYLFCSQFGKELNKRSAQDCIKDYNNKRGISKSSAHLYRHTFAKRWILKGGDLFTLQKMLGHSSLDIVKEYVNIFSEELDIKYRQYNLLDDFLAKQNGDKIKIES